MIFMLNRIFALLILSLAMIACGQIEGRQNVNERQAVRADGILVRPSPFTSSITSTADILPFEQVELSSPISGNVLEIYFREGQNVRKGDLLVKIDDRTWKAQQKGLEARLSSANNELDRSRALLEIEGASREDVDRAEAEVTNLQAQIEEMQVRINLANIRAPFSGRVGMRDFSTGAFLSQGQRITQLVQTDKLRVNFTLPARYASFVQVDQEISVVTSASNDTSNAVIYAINPMLNVSTRSLQVRAIMDNGKNIFMPGDFANIRLKVEQLQDALMIPSESIIPEMNANVVYKVENGKAKRQPVEVGFRTETSVQVTRGITAGDTVLTTGLLQVQDGVNVQIGEIIDNLRL
jgi:membrane fusion protein, multidrug efflux system